MRKLALCFLACGVLASGACTTDGGDKAEEAAGGSSAGSSGSSAGGTGGSSSEGSGEEGGKGGEAGGGGSAPSAGNTGSGGASAGGAAGAAGSPAQPGGSGGSADAGSGGSAGADATADPPAAPDPNAPCPRCVRIFNGVDFDGWEASPSTWSIVDGAMRGIGGTSRAAYTKKDYGNVRLILTSRMNPINGDHLGVLFWGDRPADPNKPKIDLAGWLQWMPPNGGMWSYHAPRHHGVSSMRINGGPGKIDQWHTSEILLNLDKGTLRGATDGVEINRYTHQWPTERMDPTKKIIKGPIGLMRHGRGGSEYKDIWVEEDPVEDKLFTVK